MATLRLAPPLDCEYCSSHSLSYSGWMVSCVRTRTIPALSAPVVTAGSLSTAPNAIDGSAVEDVFSNAVRPEVIDGPDSTPANARKPWRSPVTSDAAGTVPTEWVVPTPGIVVLIGTAVPFAEWKNDAA